MMRRRMDRFMGAYAELGRFSGAVLVARGEKVLFSKGYGLADHERGVPNRPDTAFRIGSQTKTFTAMAILQLKERGLVRVDDPVARHLPGYPRGEHITLHHLLTNSSGIPDYITTEGFTRVMGTAVTRRELIDTFKDRQPLFEPGTGVSYSNSGWVLLGEVIERVSGQAYGDFLREHVFEPLGMTRTGLADDAKGYLYADGRAEPAPYLDNSRQDAAGALCSTVTDLHRWRLRVPDELVGPYVESDGIAYGYGCASGQGRIETSGGTIGFVGVSARYPADDLFVCVLANFENAAFSEIERGLAAIARGEPYEPPAARVFVTVDPALFDRYAGRYTMRFLGRTSIMDVTRDGDRLMVEVHGLARTELRPMSPTRYFARMKGEVELDFRDGGEVALNWAGRDVTARRVSSS
ncbi:serine hydrolase domain-containing protein [Nonomuraea rubra]